MRCLHCSCVLKTLHSESITTIKRSKKHEEIFFCSHRKLTPWCLQKQQSYFFCQIRLLRKYCCPTWGRSLIRLRLPCCLCNIQLQQKRNQTGTNEDSFTLLKLQLNMLFDSLVTCFGGKLHPRCFVSAAGEHVNKPCSMWWHTVWAESVT